MACFHVFLRGEHFLIEMDGKQSMMGFYKNVYVEASNEDEAASFAVKHAFSDPEFKAKVKNTPDNPPALNIEEITAIEKDASLVDSAFVFFPDESAG